MLPTLKPPLPLRRLDFRAALDDDELLRQQVDAAAGAAGRQVVVAPLPRRRLAVHQDAQVEVHLRAVGGVDVRLRQLRLRPRQPTLDVHCHDAALPFMLGFGGAAAASAASTFASLSTRSYSS